MMKTKTKKKRRKTTASTPLSKKRNTTAKTQLSPPAKKTETTPTSPTPEPNSILSLPHDLLLSCIARVSRLYYPTLSLVSKRFRSLVASPELYKVRSLLGRTESCLYVCVGKYSSQFRWFTLCRKPDQNFTSKKVKSSGYVLARVPNLIDNACFEGLVAVGSSIYNFDDSDSLDIVRTTYSFSILDCRSHTWSKAPGSWNNVLSFSASVLDRKIYLLAECSSKDSDTEPMKSLIHMFDTETQIWDPEPIPCGINYNQTVCINGKFHLVGLCGGKVVAYNPKEGKWDAVEEGERDEAGIAELMIGDSYCEIEDVV